VKKLLIVPAVLCFATACSQEPGSEGWCEAKKAQSKSEWSTDDAVTFTKRCVVESQTIGSEAWCEALKKKPKSDWTAGEAADYARHCVM